MQIRCKRKIGASEEKKTLVGIGDGGAGAGERETERESRKIFWDHFSKSLVTIQVFKSETWAPTRLKNGGKLS